MTYRTEQKQLIEKMFEENADMFFSVEDIEKYMKKHNQSVGQTTIYRSLKRLEEKELVRIEVKDNKKFYQYIADECSGHFHLKCKKCGKIIHLECREFEDVTSHIYEHHRFIMDHNMIIYGLCDKCKN